MDVRTGMHVSRLGNLIELISIRWPRKLRVVTSIVTFGNLVISTAPLF